MRLGLEANPPRKSLFRMSNTFVTELPDGSEEGDVLSMDLGSTNLRVLLTRLKRYEKPEYRIEHYDIDVKHRRGKPEQVITNEIFELLNKMKGLKTNLSI